MGYKMIRFGINWFRTNVVDTIVTDPMPYYGSDRCVIDGGSNSVWRDGKRYGTRAVYYVGLIDCLQPWTVRKSFEQTLKGLAGYDTTAISAVPPDVYADRFSRFMDRHIH